MNASRVEKNRTSCRAYRAKIRGRILALYGEKCVKCGFSDSRALQLDHIVGGSSHNQYRVAYGRGSTGLYVAILAGVKPVADFQLLCANCNWIKRHENHTESTKRKNYGHLEDFVSQ